MERKVCTCDNCNNIAPYDINKSNWIEIYDDRDRTDNHLCLKKYKGRTEEGNAYTKIDESHKLPLHFCSKQCLKDFFSKIVYELENNEE